MTIITVVVIFLLLLRLFVRELPRQYSLRCRTICTCGPIYANYSRLPRENHMFYAFVGFQYYHYGIHYCYLYLLLFFLSFQTTTNKDFQSAGQLYVPLAGPFRSLKNLKCSQKYTPITLIMQILCYILYRHITFII